VYFSGLSGRDSLLSSGFLSLGLGLGNSEGFCTSDKASFWACRVTSWVELGAFVDSVSVRSRYLVPFWFWVRRRGSFNHL